jgi:hypothetical protein
MKKLIPGIAIVMAGCVYPRYAQPIATTQPDNNIDYKVSYLFEYGGCKIYRFYDYGNTVYFTNCGGDTVAFADSTQVRSTGFMNNKPFLNSPDAGSSDSVRYKIKPTDISPYYKTR